jgi:predicted PurR-regulated permease PerM
MSGERNKKLAPAKPDREKDSTVPVPPTTLFQWMQGQMKTDLLFRLLLVLLIMIAGLYLLGMAWSASAFFSSLILLMFMSWVVALLLTPPIKLFLRLGLPKPISILIAYLLLSGILSLLILLFLPDLIQQTTDLSGDITGIFNNIILWFRDLLRSWGLENLDLNQVATQLQGFGIELLRGSLNTLTGLPGFVLQILLVVIISATLLAGNDYDMPNLKKPAKNKRSLWSHLPESWKKWLYMLSVSFEKNIGVFLGSQITIGVLYGFVVSITMSVAGYPYTVSTGVFCGIIMLIPFFGGPLSLIPPLLVSIGTERPILPIWVVIIVIWAFQTVELNVLQPRMVGERSGIGPVATLLILLAGGQIGGIWGVVLAVPLAGVAKNMFDYTVALILKDYEEIKEREANLKPIEPAPVEPETAPPVQPSPPVEVKKPVYPKHHHSRVDRILSVITKEKRK